MAPRVPESHPPSLHSRLRRVALYLVRSLSLNRFKRFPKSLDFVALPSCARSSTFRTRNGQERTDLHRDTPVFGPRIVRGAAAPRRVIVSYLPYLLRSLFYPVFRIRMLNVLVIFDVARPFKAETLTYSLTFFNLLSSLLSLSARSLVSLRRKNEKNFEKRRCLRKESFFKRMVDNRRVVSRV